MKYPAEGVRQRKCSGSMTSIEPYAVGADRPKIAFLSYCVCRGGHWPPVSLPQKRIFRDSFRTRQTGAGEQCSPLQELFDSLCPLAERSQLVEKACYRKICRDGS